LQTAKYRVFGSDRLRTLSVEVKDGVPIQQGMVDLERILRREHKIRPGAENDFTIRNPQDILATQQEATQVFTTLLASIAAVSLVVGGIGIMNIMLVSVTERTREIGLRQALGARRRDVRNQFLIEAIVLCAFGGLAGVLLGIGVTIAIANLAGWPVFVSPAAMMLSFGFASAIGMFFGFYPAHKASRLDPIEALRFE
jgi:putative ABC transport system permease protein